MAVFDFEEFRDKIVKPEFDAGNIDCHKSLTLDEVANTMLLFYLERGYLIKQEIGGHTVYVRTEKRIPNR